MQPGSRMQPRSPAAASPSLSPSHHPWPHPALPEQPRREQPAKKNPSQKRSQVPVAHLENPRDARHMAAPGDSIPGTAGPWDGAGGSCRSLCRAAGGGASRQPGSVAASRRDPASGDEPSPVQTVWRRSRLGCSRCCLRSRRPTAEPGRRCLDMCKTRLKAGEREGREERNLKPSGSALGSN